MKYCFLCALFLTITLSGLSQAPNPEPVFNIQFRLLADRGGIRDLYLRPASDAQDPEYILAPSHKPSDWIQYRGPLPVPVFKVGETQMVPSEAPGGGEMVEVPRPVAFLNPGSSGKWLFLLQTLRDENGNLVYKSFAIKDESQEIGAGYLVYNLTNTVFAVKMNDQIHQMAAGSRFHFTPKAQEDGTVDLVIGQYEGGTWELVNTNTILMPEEGLTTMFLTRNGRRVWIRRFVDKPRRDE